MQATQDETQSCRVFGLNTGQTSLSEKTFQTFVFEADDHQRIVT